MSCLKTYITINSLISDYTPKIHITAQQNILDDKYNNEKFKFIIQHYLVQISLKITICNFL